LRKLTIIAGCTICLLALLFTFQQVLAHTAVQVGDYDVEVGWLEEPPIVGQRNAIVVNVAAPGASDSEQTPQPIDVSGLVVDVTYGGETKTLSLEPLSEDSVNQFVAAILPTVAGTYTVQLRGRLGGTEADVDVEVEEVATADAIAFPATASSETASAPSMGWSQWLAPLGFLAGIAGLVVAVIALRRTR
jgi:hypothetical protein